MLISLAQWERIRIDFSADECAEVEAAIIGQSPMANVVDQRQLTLRTSAKLLKLLLATRAAGA